MRFTVCISSSIAERWLSTVENFAKIGLSADSEKEIYHLMDAVQKTLVVLDDKGNNLIKQNVPAELLEE